ncbi:diaminopimelate decarboxylase [Chengkuizengella axinellae]|uniref:Diaminopimelate decarboxylase n=1 Tax=Chengkuizengella axinellae TaxID=3064388 RepID=A0ABT9J0Z5_9BACL|nr:diaminopimelate decarboxylase [Chengkuizengella sp. 2205SS18-9]MDP5275290.1 diaminopimelate decarboxylase [Chengkuizengella sp. 2205SS18-9]
MYLSGTSKSNEQGQLEIGGCNAIVLAAQYGTPLYVYDEKSIREKIHSYIHAFKKHDVKFDIAYASKALCNIAICQVIKEEGLSLDVVSAGELYTALKAGIPASRIHFHGNNKSPEELEMALQAKVGSYIVDNFYELDLLNTLAEKYHQTVSILFRVSPGVKAHTHQYMQTGQQDSKFGFDIISGQALEAVELLNSRSNLRFLGFHCHLGSQIFEKEGYLIALQRFFDLIEESKQQFDIETRVINLGGGFGIRYTEEDHPLGTEEFIDSIVEAVKIECNERKLDSLPEIWIEPGRSIVGEAGTTLYTIGSEKEIPDIKKYVAVDGGMTDNLRPALYQGKYNAFIANRVEDDPVEVVSIAGRCCESGDMLIHDIKLPKVKAGEILAVTSTGAYGYSMANNYNRIPRPAMVFVKDGKSKLVLKRETLDQLIQNDLELC